MESYSVRAVLSAIDNGFSSTMLKADKTVNKFSKGYFNTVKKVGKYSAVMATIMGGGMIKAGADFEEGMSKVGAISKASTSDMKKLTDKAREMGEVTQFSATESSEALKYMAMAGWNTEKMLDGLPGVMNLAAASGEDLATVSDIVTDTMTALGMKAKEASRFSNVLAIASSNANTNVGLMGESFKYVAPVAGALGYNIEDTAIALSLLADNGTKASRAGTSLKTALNNLSSPTKSMKSAMDKLGISIFNSDGSAKKFKDVMVNIRGSFKDLTQKQKMQAASTIFGKEAMEGMLALINTSDEKFNKLTKNMYNSSKAAEEMAKKMNDNLKGDFKLFKSALEGLSITLYKTESGPLRAIVQSMTEFVKRLNEGAKELDKFSKKLKTIGSNSEKLELISKKLEPLKPLLAVLGSSFITAFSAPLLSKFATTSSKSMNVLSKGLETLNTKVKYCSSFLPKLNLVDRLFPKIKASSKVEGLIGGITKSLFLLTKASLGIIAPAAIVGIFIAGLGLLYQNFGTEIDKMISMAITKGPFIIQGLVTGITSKLPDLIKSGSQMFSGLSKVIASNLPVIIQGGVDIINALINGLGNNMDSLLSSTVLIITTIVNGIINAVPQLIMAGFNLIKSLTQGMLNNMELITNSVTSMINTFTNNIKIYLPKIITTGMEILMNLAQGLVNMLPALIPAATNAIVTIIQTISANFPKILTTGFNIIITLVQGIVDNLPAIINSAIEVISTLVQSIVSNLPAIAMAGLQIVITLGVALLKSIPKLFGVGHKIMWGIGKGILKGALEAFKKIWDVVTGFWGKLWDWVTGKSKKATKDIVDDNKNMKDGIASEYGEAREAVVGNNSKMLSDTKATFGGIQSAVTSSVGKTKNTAVGEFSEMNFASSKHMQDLMSTTVNTGSKMDSNFSKSVSAMGKSYDSTLIGMKNTNVTSFNSMGDSSKILGTKFKETSSDITKSMNEVDKSISDASNSISSKWQEAMNKIVSLTKKANSDITGSFSSLRNSMHSIGYNAGMGLYYGLSSTMGALFRLASSIAYSIASRIRSALNIHSPSRVLMEIGGYVGEGLAVGMENSKTLVDKASLMLSEAAVVNPLMDRVNSLGLNQTATIEHEISDANARPAYINFRFGDKNFRAFIEDISNAQNQEIMLEAM